MLEELPRDLPLSGKPCNTQPIGGQRLRLRTALLAIAALASGLAAYRPIRERLAYRRERAGFYDASANTLEGLTRWTGLIVDFRGGPGPAVVARMRAGAAEHRDRAAAYRPWLRLPDEPSKRAAGQWILPCPNEITSGPSDVRPWIGSAPGAGPG
jgi:hypothetical protein